MRKGNANVKNLRSFANIDANIIVELNRKMKINGQIAYFVVTSRYDNPHDHIAIREWKGIQKAYASFMRASGLDVNYGTGYGTY